MIILIDTKNYNNSTGFPIVFADTRWSGHSPFLN